MDLASCTTAVVRCDDTPTATGVWPVVGQVLLAGLLLVLVVLLALGWWRGPLRRRRPVRVPQRRVHVSAAGEVLGVEERPTA